MAQIMKLQNRLSDLERRKASRIDTGRASEALLAKVETIAARVRDGDLSDTDNASTAERVALAFERGDSAFARNLLLKAVGREAN
jgi:hypothetical protein